MKIKHTRHDSIFTDTVDDLYSRLDNECIREVKIVKEDSLIGRFHFGLGRWIRNNYKLWEDSALSIWFRTNGIDHPDAMSSHIILSLYRKIHNKPYDFKNL